MRLAMPLWLPTLLLPVNAVASTLGPNFCYQN